LSTVTLYRLLVDHAQRRVDCAFLLAGTQQQLDLLGRVFVRDAQAARNLLDVRRFPGRERTRFPPMAEPAPGLTARL
jgi:hypothetical protein